MEVDRERVTRLVCIFISYGNKNKGSPPSSRRRQRSSALQLIFRAVVTQIKKKQMQKHLLLFYGAGDEARTRYLHLGKVALYRMSYTREQVVL